MGIAKALWQREIERVAPGGAVLEVSATQDFTSKKWSVSASTYGVVEATVRSLSASNLATEAEASKAAYDLANRLLGGEGSSAPREIVRDLPEAPAGATTQIVAAQFKAVAVPSPCAKPLPSELRLTSSEAQFGADLAALWKASVGTAGTAAPLSCVLNAKQKSNEFAGSSMHSFEATLLCDPDHFEVRKTDLTRGRAEGQALSEILQKVFAAWCK